MKMHPLILLFVFLINIFSVLIMGPCRMTGVLFVLHIILCLIAGLKVKTFFKLLGLVFLFSISLFIINYFYSTFDLALYNFIRASLLTFISVSASFVIDFEWLLLYLMSRGILASTKGYPIFAAINALEHLKEEKKRLDHLAHMRGLNNFRYQLHQLIPLLVFALRHSQRAATAMIARGLNDNKVFYFEYDIRKKDLLIGLIFFLIQITFFFWHFLTIS